MSDPSSSRRWRSEWRDWSGEGGGEIDRIAFFSDAVFAIAITLLVIEIAVPSDRLVGHGLTQALKDLGPKYFGFALSFLVIGRFWVGHHRMFQFLRRWDVGLMWMNLGLLLGIAFLPFPTAVLGDHVDDPVAQAFYAAVVGATGLISSLLWCYVAYWRKLIDPRIDRETLHRSTLRTFSSPIVFAISIPLVGVSVDLWGWDVSLAVLCWLFLLPILRLAASFIRFEERERDQEHR